MIGSMGRCTGIMHIFNDHVVIRVTIVNRSRLLPLTPLIVSHQTATRIVQQPPPRLHPNLSELFGVELADLKVTIDQPQMSITAPPTLVIKRSIDVKRYA